MALILSGVTGTLFNLRITSSERKPGATKQPQGSHTTAQ